MVHRLNAGLAAVLASVALAAAAGSPEARTLTIATYVPSTHVAVTEGYEPYFAAVEKQTGGSLKFQLHPGGSLAGGRTILKSIRDGLIDGGHITDIYTVKDMPVVATLISGLALLGEDARVMAGAANETILLDCPRCLADFTRNKVQQIATYATTPYRLLCQRPQAASLDEVQGLKVRSPGDWAVWVTALGATPVNISSDETYEALERGQLDCSMGSIAWLRSYSLMDVVKSVNLQPLGTFQGAHFLNVSTDAWKALSAGERQAMMDNAPHAIRRLVEAYMREDDEVLKAAKAKGVALHEPDGKLKERVREITRAEFTRLADLARSRGVADPDAIIKAFTGNVEKWTKIVAETGSDFDAYEAALKREIYSKVAAQ